jgi:transcription elongation factor Elf1
MNTNEYRYYLETPRITGRRQQKFTCPHCGKIKCFVRYVDTRNGCQYVADDVGKCDHQHSCGYHYTPTEYYRDNTWDNRNVVTDGTREYCRPKPLPPFQPLPVDYVVRSHSPHSNFWQWMERDVAGRLNLTANDLRRVYDDYLIGATRSGNVIFWQIDHQGQVHGGHIMQYNKDGHREGFQGWTHIRLIRENVLPADWQLYQCLFGQHLLQKHPDARVCLVESEKTALIMAIAYGNHEKQVWMACGGLENINKEKLAPIMREGRRIVLYPDRDGVKAWAKKAHELNYLNIVVDARPVTEWWKPCDGEKADIADVVVRSIIEHTKQ